MLVIKIRFNGETRRISVDSLTSFAQLQQLLQTLYPNILLNEHIIKYTDPENDLITGKSFLCGRIF
jgi:hypothetical protein